MCSIANLARTASIFRFTLVLVNQIPRSSFISRRLLVSVLCRWLLLWPRSASLIWGFKSVRERGKSVVLGQAATALAFHLPIYSQGSRHELVYPVESASLRSPSPLGVTSSNCRQPLTHCENESIHSVAALCVPGHLNRGKDGIQLCNK